jgi:hypothetical protein
MADDEVEQNHAKWYEKTPDLLQGTILRNIRVFEEAVESTAEDPVVRAEELDLIVLTQSCDIPKDSQPRLLTAEIQGYRDMVRAREGTESAKSGYKKHLIRNNAVSDMLLPPCKLLSMDDYLIVNLSRVTHRDPGSCPVGGGLYLLGFAIPRTLKPGVRNVHDACRTPDTAPSRV